MSRSAADATRFTATSPHAYSKPSTLRSTGVNTFSPSSAPRSQTQLPNASQTFQFRGSGGPSETPAQKVARLRAQHEASKLGQITTWDKIVIRGRVWADKAHRITTMSLIGFSGKWKLRQEHYLSITNHMVYTVICTLVTVFSLGDMVVYNRRKRNAFYAEQRMLLQQRLAEAREAAATGTADEDQTLLLNRERAAEEAEAARKARKGPTAYLKALFSTEGLKKEETDSALNHLGEEGLRKMGEEASDNGVLVEVGAQTRKQSGEPESNQSNILNLVNDQRREGEREAESRGAPGGPLDKVAERTAEAVKPNKGWNPWK